MKTQRNHFVLLAGVMLGMALIAGSAGAQVWQEWVETYNRTGHSHEYFAAMTMDESANIYVTGTSSLEWDNPAVTVKYNSSGVQQWASTYMWHHRYGGVSDIAVDGQGNVYLTGAINVSQSSYAQDMVTVKFNSAGVQQWVVTYDADSSGQYDSGVAVAVDSAGNVYVLDRSPRQGFGMDFVTLKYNSSGILQWAVLHNGSANSDDYPRAMALDDAGNVYVTGVSIEIGSGADYLTIKYNPQGIQQWATYYTGPPHGGADPSDLALDNEANVYVTGSSWANEPRSSAVTVKYNTNGVQQWVSRHTGSAPYNDFTTVCCIAVDDSGNVYVAGDHHINFFEDDDYITIRINSAGEEQWTRIYSGSNFSFDYATGLCVDHEGNAYVTGTSEAYYLDPSNVTIKYDSLGQEKWLMRFPNLGGPFFGIGIDAGENLYVAGSCQWGNNIDFTTFKYSQSPLLDVTLTPLNPPIVIPTNGGSFNFTVELSNTSQSPQTLDAWISVQLPGGLWYGPVLGPIELTLPGGGNLTRLRTQNVPGGAPPGTYVYRGYIGLYSATWDSSSFTFEKLGNGDWGLGISNWNNTGESFGIDEGHFRTYNLEFRTSVTPNPFNPRTVLSYQLPIASQVRLDVYDLSGRLVTELVNGRKDAGVHQVTWNASGIPSGLYFCRIEAGSLRDVIKMMLVK